MTALPGHTMTFGARSSSRQTISTDDRRAIRPFWAAFALTALWRLAAPAFAGSLTPLEAQFLHISERYFSIAFLLSLKAGQAPAGLLALRAASWISENPLFLRMLSALFCIAAAAGLCAIGGRLGFRRSALVASAAWLLAPSTHAVATHIGPAAPALAVLFWTLYCAVSCAAGDEPELYAAPLAVLTVCSAWVSFASLPILAAVFLAWRHWPERRPGGLNRIPPGLIKTIALWTSPAVVALALMAGHLAPGWTMGERTSAVSGLCFPFRAGAALLSRDATFGGAPGAVAGACVFGFLVLAALQGGRRGEKQAFLATALAASAIFMGAAGALLSIPSWPALGVFWSGPALLIFAGPFETARKPAFALFAGLLVLCLSLATYRDVKSRPDGPDWKTAVQTLDEKAAPEDALIVSNPKNLAVVRRYLSKDLEILALPLWTSNRMSGKGPYELLPLYPDPATREAVEDLFVRHSRVWMISDGTATGATPAAEWIETRAIRKTELETGAIEVSLLALGNSVAKKDLVAEGLIRRGDFLSALELLNGPEELIAKMEALGAYDTAAAAADAAHKTLGQALDAAARQENAEETAGSEASLYFLLVGRMEAKGFASERIAVEAFLLDRLKSESVWRRFWRFDSLPSKLFSQAKDFARKEDARLEKQPDSTSLRKDVWLAFLQLEPGNVSTRLNLINYFLGSGDCGEAEIHYDAAAKAEPGNPYLARFAARFPCARR